MVFSRRKKAIKKKRKEKAEKPSHPHLPREKGDLLLRSLQGGQTELPRSFGQVKLPFVDLQEQ